MWFADGAIDSKLRALLAGVLVVACHDSTVEIGDTETSTSKSPTGETGVIEDDSTTGSPIVFCEGEVRVRYDADDSEVDAFPDDRLTEDAPTATGLRVRLLQPNAPYDHFPGLFDGLAMLDGFGITAPAFLRIDGEIDVETLPAAGSETDPATSSLLLADLDAPGPAFVPFEWRVEPEPGGATTLLVEPLRPLQPGHRYGLALTVEAKDPQGGCIAPSEVMQDLLAGTADEPSLMRLRERHVDLLERLVAAGAVEGPGDLAAAVVFTTQTTLHESTAIASTIKHANPPPLQPGSCGFHGNCRRCEVTLTMADFRDDKGVLAADLEPQAFYSLPVSVFYPVSGSVPYPTIVYGHGLDGSRHFASSVATRVCAEGYAVVAIDAPKHGEHPDGAIVQSALDLMGISDDPDDPFVAVRARDNFRQATYDKLQLLRRIESGFDVDGDGQPDLDFGRLHYVGESLGAVMAPPFLAYAPQVRSATLVVGGVRLTSIISDPSELAGIVVLVTAGMHRSERVRFLAMTQAAIDRGDPEVFAQYVTGARLEGFDTGYPHVLMQMVADDTIVPNASTAHLARALATPIAGPEHVPMRDVVVESDLPLQGNLPSGHTAAVFQFTHVTPPGAPNHSEEATHTNVQSDLYAREQRMTFLLTSENPEGALVIDPHP